VTSEKTTMIKTVTLLASIILLFTFQSAHSAEAAGETQSATISPDSDHRQLVSMPDETIQLMRQDMLDHLSALNEIIGLLAENNLDAAAGVAETRMGKSSMGKHRATGMGPGRFMPLEMRNIGLGMHESATELSQAAREGNIKGTYSALQKVTASCVACHYSYRTR
jgi:hypothetical protein